MKMVKIMNRYIITFSISLFGVLNLVSAEDDVNHGKQLYQSNCSGCHGFRGDGEGLAAKYLNPLPRDFTKGKYKFRTTPSGSLPTDENIAKIIRKGVRRTSMPAWENILSDNDISDVVAYLKTLAEKFSIQDPAPELTIPSTIPEKTDALIQEGVMVYRLMECWNCHGPHGEVDGPTSDKLVDDWGNKIVAPNFKNEVFKGGDDPVEVYRTFSTGLTGTPMPGYDDDSFGFAREDVEGDYDNLYNVYSDEEVNEYAAWAESIISGDELYNLPEDEMYEIFQRRKWAMVYYVLSLREKESLVYKLFVKDYELTQ
ncbi:MAG: hypothetical protein CMG29_04280 [Candidatus Marinimicrobia bacterium]|jgi:cytochrome c oxidase cbb3-type subunit 2|nr:hypothetical protein [Candidatus Neomarinimicrobiota bacterium]|tara:strand:+ start:2997 stop:3935 length:939 start_codon:yes stop_codon:yes gene_type:complete